jgi:hypothetical protein
MEQEHDGLKLLRQALAAELRRGFDLPTTACQALIPPSAAPHPRLQSTHPSSADPGARRAGPLRGLLCNGIICQLSVRKVVPTLTSKSAEIYLSMAGAKQQVTRDLSWSQPGPYVQQ